MKREIGIRIAKLRREMNMNKEKFARLMGISGQYLGTVEAGTHGISLDTLIKLCEKTNTSADYILFGKKHIAEKKLKDTFNGISSEQIYTAFETLQDIALFIKSKGE